MAVVALPIAIVTSWVLYQRCKWSSTFCLFVCCCVAARVRPGCDSGDLCCCGYECVCLSVPIANARCSGVGGGAETACEGTAGRVDIRGEAVVSTQST